MAASGKRFFVMLTGLTHGKSSTIIISHNQIRKSQNKLLKKVDVFAEPLSERFNEFIDILAVSFDLAKEAVFGTIEQNRPKTVETEVKVKTTPGRHARVKV